MIDTEETGTVFQLVLLIQTGLCIFATMLQ